MDILITCRVNFACMPVEFHVKYFVGGEGVIFSGHRCIV